jgi:cyclohexanone monooxygenase
VSHRIRIVVVGAGPGGLCAAIRLRQAGHDDLVVLEKSAGVGGTWWNNRYPGLGCDIASHLYSFSFAIKRNWTRPYATQPEIQAYMEKCVSDFGLWPDIRLNTAVRSARWDDATSTWTLVTDAGDEFVADIVVSSQGMFNELNWPDIDGRDTFGGTSFHSGAWNTRHDLTGERVAVIGSAASAVQFVPEIAPKVARLHLYQRAANWVLPKEDAPFTAEQLERFVTDPEASLEERRKIYDRVDKAITFSDPEMLRAAEAAGLANISVVEDPDVRARLVPKTPYGCQRPLISNDYYPTFNRANVELVTDPIARITPTGVVTADGVERSVDTIVYATGYQTTKYASSIDYVGRDGSRIVDAWGDGAQAYLGITTSGFPNLFMIYGPNTNNGSIIFMIECQVDYVVRQVERMDREGLAWMDVRPAAMASYNEQLQRDLDGIAVWQSGCHQYYRVPSGRIVTQWPHSMTEYRRRTERPDAGAYEVGVRLAG